MNRPASGAQVGFDADAPADAAREPLHGILPVIVAATTTPRAARPPTAKSRKRVIG
jgi:hypothetical protein